MLDLDKRIHCTYRDNQCRASDMSGPEAEPVSADRVSAARCIAAPAHAIFLLVSDPARHVDIDGSGMLQAAPTLSRSRRSARRSTWTWTAVPWATSPTWPSTRCAAP